jgi:hypothetical protein
MSDQSEMGPRVLTVVIRDISPFVFLGDSVTHRTVRIELTPEQRERIQLRWCGTDRGSDVYEAVSSCFFEEATDED